MHTAGRWRGALAAAWLAAWLAACGGADPARQTGTAAAAWPAGRAAIAQVPDVFAQRRRPLATGGDSAAYIEPDQLFNWAQMNFPQFFPGHSPTLQQGAWTYRAYPATGVMIGLSGGDVHVVGGPFGDVPQRVGAATEFIGPALPVLATSHENRLQVRETGIPYLHEIGIQPEPGESGFNQRIAFGDFFQEGTAAAVAFSWMHRGVFPAHFNPGRAPDAGAKLYFLKKDPAGRWVDGTATLIRDGQRHTCITPTFIEVADLNHDLRPDVVIACTGVDFGFELPAGETDARPYWVSRQYVVLSQPDGTYRLREVPVASPIKPFDAPDSSGGIYAHQAAVADIDGDGHADILYTDPVANAQPIVMWGRGDGSFRQDLAPFPADTRHQAINGIRAVPVEGSLRVILSGNHPGSDPFASSPLLGYGTQVLRFVDGAFRVEADLTRSVPMAPDGRPYAFAQDFVYADGAYYGYFVDIMSQQQAIVKLVDAAHPGSTLFTLVGGVGGQAGNSGNLTLIDGVFHGINAGCGEQATQASDFMHQVCAIHVPLR